MIPFSLGEWLLADMQQSVSKAAPGALHRYRSVYEGIRKAILSRRMSAGIRLPSSRALAEELGVSRNTVVAAFDQLLAEGYVTAATGSGTYVSDIGRGENIRPKPVRLHRGPALSARGRRIVAAPGGNTHEIQPFVPGMDDFSVFPSKIWQRLQNKYWRESPPELLDYAAAGGYQPLRRTIANYLSISRSVQVTAEQVLITAGTQQSLHLCAQLLASPGELAWVEDPGYWAARKVFEACDLTLRPIAVDVEGMHPAAADIATSPRLIYVTPSHHYPTSAVMSLPRRQGLLDLAAGKGAWILEDDYDSEFRYSGRPLSSLQGLDSHDCVIYLGTFSKILYPGIKLGYLVVPADLAQSFKTSLYDTQRPGQVMLQAALADFIEQGHFATHVRKVRQVYGERRESLVRVLQSILGRHARLSKEASGMHLVIELPDAASDLHIAAEAAKQGLVVRALSSYYLGQPQRSGLVVGYAYVPTERIQHFGSLLGNIVKKALRR